MKILFTALLVLLLSACDKSEQEKVDLIFKYLCVDSTDSSPQKINTYYQHVMMLKAKGQTTVCTMKKEST